MVVTTSDDLRDWMDENEEDVIMDGPWYMSIPQFNELGNRVIEKLNTKYGVTVPPPTNQTEDWYENAWETVHDSGIDSDDAMDLFLEAMAGIITEKNIQKS